MTCTNCVLDCSDKNCPVLTEVDVLVILIKFSASPFELGCSGVYVVDGTLSFVHTDPSHGC